MTLTVAKSKKRYPDLQRQCDGFPNTVLQRLHLCRYPNGCGQNRLRVHGYYARFVEARGYLFLVPKSVE